jgi:hypothetical protein
LVIELRFAMTASLQSNRRANEDVETVDGSTRLSGGDREV